MKRTFAAILVSALALSLAVTTGATADEPPPLPGVTDPAGDANAINGQGFLTGTEEGPDTRPVSWDGADLVHVQYETTFTRKKVRGANRKVLGVEYTPTGLRVKFTTLGPIGTPGPTAIYRIDANLGECNVFFQMYVRGPSAAPSDVQRGEVRKLTATCPGGATTYASGVNMAVRGNVAIVEYPFDAFVGVQQGLIAPGVEITGSLPQVRTLLGTVVTLTAPQIDEAVEMPPFVIGSDVPANVDCRQTPEADGCPS